MNSHGYNYFFLNNLDMSLHGGRPSYKFFIPHDGRYGRVCCELLRQAFWAFWLQAQWGSKVTKD